MPNFSPLRRAADLLVTRVSTSFGYRLRRHIGLALQERALQETADYVTDRMLRATPVDDPAHFLKVSAAACSLNDGLVLECGVWQGSSIRVLAKLFREQIYGFDSFAGLPEHWRTDVPAGTFAVAAPPKVPANVTLVQGWFADTLPPFLSAHPGPIKFLHVDCDLYSSTVDVFRACADRLVSGSVIAFDEYFNYPGWRDGEFKAWQEFVAARRLRYRYLAYTNRHEQVAVVIE